MDSVRQGAVHVLAPIGRLDSDSTTEFELALHDLFTEGVRHFVLDLAQVSYISSRGAEAMVGMRDRLNQNKGSLRICAIQPTVRQTLQVSGFGFGLDVYRTRNDALLDHPANEAQAEAVGSLAGKLLGAAEEMMGIPDPAAVRTANRAAQLLGAKPEAMAKAPAKATAFQQSIDRPIFISKQPMASAPPPKDESDRPVENKVGATSTQPSVWLRFLRALGLKKA